MTVAPADAPMSGGRSPSASSGVAAAILAAGAGRRFAGPGPKPLASMAGRTLLALSLDAAVASGLAPVLLVVGSRGDEVAAVAPAGVEVVRNDEWETGIASSVVAAVRSVEQRPEIGALVVGLADQPLIGAEAYRRLASAHRLGACLAVATYSGRRANPVLLSREVWPAALLLEGDTGARALMREHAVTEVPCDDTGNPLDVDTPEDLAALEARWRSETDSA